MGYLETTAAEVLVTKVLCKAEVDNLEDQQDPKRRVQGSRAPRQSATAWRSFGNVFLCCLSSPRWGHETCSRSVSTNERGTETEPGICTCAAAATIACRSK